MSVAEQSGVKPGLVYLVGAGPGDPRLMTVAALEAIASAEVILYDKLIPESALDGARSDAQLIDVGKRGGGEQVPQQTTEALMVEHALAGRSVARVKGGDPFVFGRGGEEAATLREHGIDFEIVPGITSGIAAAAYAGIPVTHRDHAPGVALITGHEDPKKAESAINWQALAAFPGTLAFYMGVRRLPEIASSLIASGRPESQPAAVIQSGTEPGQRVVTGTLSTIAEIAKSAGIKAPAITVVGDVAGLRDELKWFENAPLFGRTVAVTRARAQASGLAKRLRKLGAEVIELPVIKTRSLNAALPKLDEFDLIAFTSPNGVREFVSSLVAGGNDVRGISSDTCIAAVGPGTARSLKEFGLVADVVPETFSGEGLATALSGRTVTNALLARAGATEGAAPSQALPDALRQQGARVTEVALYETVAESLAPEQLDRLLQAEFITFTSASTVRYLGMATAEVSQESGSPLGLSKETLIASIGPLTSEALAEFGAVPAITASNATIDGLIEALVELAS